MHRLLIIALFSSLIISLHAKEAPPALRQSMEQVYETWRNAMLKKDYTSWKKVTAYARQVETRNVVVSQKKQFPGAVFAVPMKPPSLMKLKPLSVQSNGPTATAIYFGQVDFEVDAAAPTSSLLVLRYLKEDTWKFHSLAVMGGLPVDVIEDIGANRLGFLKEPEFQPSGRSPKVQQPCPKPDHIADLHVISLGFETEVVINGISEHTTSDDFGTQLVIGGLKNGKNTISIKSRKMSKSVSGQKNLKVTAHVKTGNRKNPAVNVFEFKPDPAKGPFAYKGSFVIDKAALRR